MLNRFLYVCVLCLAGLSFIACGGASKSDENAIFVNVGPEPETMDPTLNSSIDGSIYISHAFEGLIARDKNNKAVPGMAKNWDVSSDGMKYTFHLKDGILWSDGKPVVAADFVYAWRRAVDPLVASEYSYQMEVLKNAKAIIEGEMPIDALGVVAIDDKTLEVSLEAPTAYFLELASSITYFPVREDIVKQYGMDWTLKPETYISNGPFVMSERRTDDKIVMIKNTNYYGKDSVVADKIVFVLMDNPTGSVAGVKEGSLHFAKNPPPQDIPLLQEEGILKIAPYIGTYYYSLNTTNKTIEDVRVRKALSLAIDRNYIVEKVTQSGQEPAAAWVPNGISDIKNDFRDNGGDYISVKPADYEKNIEEAKKLMAEAGYPNGAGFPVIEFKSQAGNHLITFEAIQQMWKDVLNIDTRVVTEESAVFSISKYKKDFTIAHGLWVGDYNDPMTFMALFTSTSPQNTAAYANPEYDKLIETASLSGDNNVRMKAMHDAEALLFRDTVLIPLYFYTEAIVVNPKLKDVVYDGLATHKFNYSYIAE